MSLTVCEAFYFPKIVLIVLGGWLHTKTMRKSRLIVFVLIAVSLVFAVTLSTGEGVAFAQGVYVYLGGYPIGISTTPNGLIVVELTDVQTDNGLMRPLDGVGVVKGDVLTEINGEDLTGIFQLKQILADTEGDVELTIRHRNGAECEVSVTPAVCRTGERKLGVILKEDVSGIGTMTFVTLDNDFGALGHHIIDGESGLCDELNKGKIYNTSINDVVKGQNGKAGGLVASLNKLSTPIGEVIQNSNIGIYGRFYGRPQGELIEIAGSGEATMGKAQIYTTIDGAVPDFYDVEIVKVIEQNTPKEKGLVVHVKDARLIENTGGIVQGMSGSPIIQNGKLVGAVTHVFVDDPTRGYGVHSRFMYQMATKTKSIEERKVA